MPLLPATQSQFIRSSQKDEHYQMFLRNNANQAFQTLAGCKKWLDWKKEIELLSDLMYYILTSLSGYQTLGEEYVNIVQVDPSKRQLPSKARRGLFVSSHVFLPYFLDKVLVSMENEIEGGQENRSSGTVQEQAAVKLWSLESILRRVIQTFLGLLTDAQKRACLLPVFALQQTLYFLHRFHVALFYISGSFYHMSKRAANICYVSVVRLSSDDDTIRASYRLLGALSLLQVVITVCLQFNNFRRSQSARQDLKHRNFSVNVTSKTSPQHTQTMDPRAARCILCLEQRINSTCTPCGHLFCWGCITQWCNNKAECPLCREKFQPQRLVYLQNFN